jgi:uncharacterized protein (DUF58 family)
MVLGAAPLFMAGVIYAPLTGVGVIYVLLLAAYAGVDALLLPRRRQVQVKRLVPERISLGVGGRVVFEVFYTGRRSLEIRLAENVPQDMEMHPLECVGVVGPGAGSVLEYRLLARKRGRYQLSDVDVRLRPVLGLFYRQFRLQLPAEVQVFPDLVNVKKYELLLRRGLTVEQGLARIHQLGQGWEFESLRPYAEGDGMSHVDWKATAKMGRLIVRDYQVERKQSVMVAIDVGRATAGEFEGFSRLDYLVNAALMLAYVSLRQGDWFSLVAFSDRIESYLPPVRRVESIDRVARTLYHLEPRLVESDYAAACRFMGLKNRKRSLLVLMTDVIDREASAVIIAYLARFARSHLPLAVTLADAEVRGVAAQSLASRPDPYGKAAALDVLVAREEALQAMRRRGVDVLDVPPRALTPQLIHRYLSIKATRRL